MRVNKEIKVNHVLSESFDREAQTTLNKFEKKLNENKVQEVEDFEDELDKDEVLYLGLD